MVLWAYVGLGRKNLVCGLLSGQHTRVALHPSICMLQPELKPLSKLSWLLEIAGGEGSKAGMPCAHAHPSYTQALPDHDALHPIKSSAVNNKMLPLYRPYCPLSTAQAILPTLYCTGHTAHSPLYRPYCPLSTLHCTDHTAHSPLYRPYCPLSNTA